ncbi:hypothetical protein [Paenibacillus humicola]|nr:hypothetical protein [Paenibacillus humicola]
MRCPEDRKEQIARLLWEHQALTVGMLAVPPLSSYDAMPQRTREA